MELILVTTERQIFKDPLTAVTFPGRINTLKSFWMKSCSIRKKEGVQEQKQSWDCNFKLKANSHEIGSMTL